MSQDLIYHGVTFHRTCMACVNDEDHDWSGPVVEREGESTSTCAKCGIEFGHWALFSMD